MEGGIDTESSCGILSNMKTILKLITALLLIPFLFPSAYFAYRASQPLTTPEFKGLTWYQLTEWRYREFARLEMELIVYHPGSVKFLAKPVTERNNKCFYIRTAVFALVPLQAFGFTFAGLKGARPSAAYAIPTDVTYSNFMDKWWTTAEVIEWVNAENSHTSTPLPECKINHANMPSADQYDTVMEKLKARVAELEAINAKRNAAQANE